MYTWWMVVILLKSTHRLRFTPTVRLLGLFLNRSLGGHCIYLWAGLRPGRRDAVWAGWEQCNPVDSPGQPRGQKRGAQWALRWGLGGVSYKARQGLTSWSRSQWTAVGDMSQWSSLATTKEILSVSCPPLSNKVQLKGSFSKKNKKLVVQPENVEIVQTLKLLLTLKKTTRSA